MVQKVETVLTDDLDGGPADTTVRFGWSGTEYEIDLSAAHASEFQTIMEPYVQSGRKTGGTVRRTSRAGSRRGSDEGPQSADVRAWAKREGITVNDRGRIPAELVVKFQAANEQ